MRESMIHYIIRLKLFIEFMPNALHKTSKELGFVTFCPQAFLTRCNFFIVSPPTALVLLTPYSGINKYGTKDQNPQHYEI